MKSRKFFSLFERLGYRAANSMVALALAYFSGSQELGLYAFGSLGLTLILSMTDSPLRQYIAGASVSGLLPVNLVKRIVSFGIIGSLILLILIMILSFSLPETAETFLKLVALAPVPALTCLSMIYQAKLEYQGNWRQIFKVQIVSVLVATLVAVALLQSLGAGAANIQTLVAEILFLAGVSKLKRISILETPTSDFKGTIGTPILSSLFGWLQGQSDRLTLGIISGASQLGVYSLALSFTRTIGDAISSGINNNLRSEIMGRTGSQPSNQSAGDAVKLGLRISIVQQVLLCSLVAPLVGVVFKDWSEVPQLISLMSFGLLVGSLSWTLSNYLVISGFGRLLLPWQILAVLLSLIGGIFLSISLEWGYLSLLVRDLVILYSRVRISRKIGLTLERSTYKYITASFLIAATSTTLITIL